MFEATVPEFLLLRMRYFVLFIPLIFIIPLFGLDTFSFTYGAVSGGKGIDYVITQLADVNVGFILFGITGIYYNRKLWSEQFSKFFLVYLAMFFVLIIFFSGRAWRFFLLVPFLFFAIGGSKEIWRESRYLFLFLYLITILHHLADVIFVSVP